MYNRGPETATIHVLPTLWFRNTWTWEEDEQKPTLRQADGGAIHASHLKLGDYTLQCEGKPELLFTENESNASRLWGQPNPSPYVKDAFHRYVISGEHDAVNPAKTGTKATAHYAVEVPAGGSRVMRLRLSAKPASDAFKTFDLRHPPRRCQRILRAHHSERAERRRTSHPPPGACRDDVVQAVLLFRSRSMADRA